MHGRICVGANVLLCTTVTKHKILAKVFSHILCSPEP